MGRYFIKGIRGEIPQKALFFFGNMKGFGDNFDEFQFLIADLLLVGFDKFKQLNYNNELLLLRQFGIDIVADPQDFHGIGTNAAVSPLALKGLMLAVVGIKNIHVIAYQFLV